MSLWFKRFLGLILLVTTVGIATCQSLVKADNDPTGNAYSSPVSAIYR